MAIKKVAILTAVVGQGHMSAALALDYWLTEWGYSTVVVNAGTAANQDIHKLLLKNKFAYKSFFSLSNNYRVPGVFVKAYSKLVEKALTKTLPKYSEYDAVISTYPMIHPQLGKKNIMLLLDPVVHTSYVSAPTMDNYISFWDECDELKKRMKITLIGPLSRIAFYNQAKYLLNGGNKSSLKSQLGIDKSTKLCLVIAGGGWIYRSEDYIDLLLKQFKGTNTTFVFACGKNKKFYTEMSEKYAGNKNIKFLDWVNGEQLSLWMTAADFGIAFALAQMVVEAGLCGLPLYIFDYAAGQEEKYRTIIERNKVGEYIDGDNEKEKVENLFKSIQKGSVSKLSLQGWQKYLVNAPSQAKEELAKII